MEYWNTESMLTMQLQSTNTQSITGRLHGTIVGPTGRSDPGYVRLSVRPVGQTVPEPPTSVNHINVAC